MSADVNQYYAIDKMTKHGATDNGIMTEDGVMYHSYSFADTGHIFINGKNTYTEISGDTGSTLVLKYRASGETNVNVEIATADKNTVASWEPTSAPTVDGDPYINISAADVATDWRVLVIDLSDFNYTKDDTQNVQVRLTTKSASIDVAYAAIVDDDTEARDLIDVVLDPTYVYYASKSATPVTKNSADGTDKN